MATRAEHRRARRAVRRGRAAATEREAELAVHVARARQAEPDEAWHRWVLGVFIAAWIVMAVGEHADGRPLVAGFFLAVSLLCGWTLLAERSSRRRAGEAERQNLARLGREPGPGAAVEPSAPRRVLIYALAFVFYVGVFGGLTRAMDDRPLTVEAIVREGLLFGILMIAWRIWWDRRARSG